MHATLSFPRGYREGRARKYRRSPPPPVIVYVGETINLEFKSYPSPGMTRMNRYAMPVYVLSTIYTGITIAKVTP